MIWEDFVDFEDFEFKPLTEGLGFHKKNSANKSASKELPPLEPKSKLSSALDNLKTTSLLGNLSQVETPKFEDAKSEAPTRLDSVFESRVELPELAPEVSVASSGLFSKVLPRTEQDVPKKIEPVVAPIPKFNPRFGRPLANPAIQDQKIQDSGILAVLDAKTQTEAVIKPNKIDTTVEVKYAEVAPAPLSLFLDVTVIAGLSILFMLGLVVATSIDIVPILNNIAQDLGAQLAVALLIYSVSQLYLVLSRSFFGQTLGEWSMDTQLGLPKEQESLSYIFKLISRTLLLTLTGFIVLPLISMIMGRDYAGRATGLKLYRK